MEPQERGHLRHLGGEGRTKVGDRLHRPAVRLNDHVSRPDPRLGRGAPIPYAGDNDARLVRDAQLLRQGRGEGLDGETQRLPKGRDFASRSTWSVAACPISVSATSLGRLLALVMRWPSYATRAGG